MDKYNEVARRCLEVTAGYIEPQVRQAAAILRESFPASEPAKNAMELAKKLRSLPSWCGVEVCSTCQEELTSAAALIQSSFEAWGKGEQSVQLACNCGVMGVQARALFARIYGAISYVANGSQLTLENPQWRFDERACDSLRDAGKALGDLELLISSRQSASEPSGEAIAKADSYLAEIERVAKKLKGYVSAANMLSLVGSARAIISTHQPKAEPSGESISANEERLYRLLSMIQSELTHRARFQDPTDWIAKLSLAIREDALLASRSAESKTVPMEPILELMRWAWPMGDDAKRMEKIKGAFAKAGYTVTESAEEEGR